MKRRGKGLINDSGFTLVELMAATAVSVLFSAAFFAAFYVMRNEFYQQSMYFNTNRAARFGMDFIARDVKEAVRVVPTRGGDTTGNAVLILELPSINASGEATNITSQFDYVVYKLDSVNPTILRKSLDVLGGTSNRNGGSDYANKEVARNINTLLFSSGGTGLSSVSNIAGILGLTVQITAKGTVLRSSDTETTLGDSTLRLRNKT